MRALACLALVACSGDPAPPAVPNCPAPTPLPGPASKDALDTFVWDHTSPVISRDEQRWAIEGQEREDLATAARRARHPLDGLRRDVTHLTVTVLDAYVWQQCKATLDGVAARHRLDIVLDGVPVGAVVVPCNEAMQSPPRAYVPPTFDVPPGLHRIRIREADTGVSAARDYVFPERGDDFALDHVGVWAAERAFDIGDLGPESMML